MLLNWIKWISIIAIITATVICLPGIALAGSANYINNRVIVLAQLNQTSSNTDLTPQQRQQIQGVRQGSIREIQKLLKFSQQSQLSRRLRAGDNLEKALQMLSIEPQKLEIIRAIQKVADLKIKAITSR